jgi:Putative DNA-binding domain
VTSIAELLPKPFDQLDVDDVATLVAGAEDRESLVLELKAELGRDLVAKSCAAFANTIGGLLVVGVPDDSEEFRGIDDDVGEAQLWVKDVLRARVLPLPPFRARRLDLENGRWLLLVLVEESSTTPHLLTRQGAIYVRNPGSSDPRPLGDQGLLLDLLHRGERARELAVGRAREVLALRHELPDYFQGPRRRLSLALASTGVSDWFEDRLLREPVGRECLAAAITEDKSPRARAVEYEWQQHALTAYRAFPGELIRPDRVEIVRVNRDGVALLRHGFVGEVSGMNEQFEHAIERDHLVRLLRRMSDAGRELLLDLGAHGELRLVVNIEAPRRIAWTAGAPWPDLDRDISVELWTPLDLSEERVDDTMTRIEEEIGRALGFEPRF